MPPENDQSTARGSRNRGPQPGTGDRRRREMPPEASEMQGNCIEIGAGMAQGMAQRRRGAGAGHGETEAQTRGAA